MTQDIGEKMNAFIKTLLSLSVSGTLLLLLIRGSKPFYKNRFSQHWQYYIWIIVALRFLLPITPDTTIVGSLFEKFNETGITDEKQVTPNMADTAGINCNEPVRTQTNTDPGTDAPDIIPYLFFTWSTLAFVLFIRKITIYQCFIQHMKTGNNEVSNIKLLNLLSDCEEKLKIRAKVGLYQNALIHSPMMTGFIHPDIILPARELEEKELSYIFTHELIHYKRKDMYYKWLIQTAACVHWFNPFVHLLEKEVNRTCELSCDETVVSILGDKAKREYGDMLISFVTTGQQYKNTLASVTLTESAEQLKERLGAIMRTNRKSKSVKMITALFTFTLCICFAAAGAYAAPGQMQEKEMQEQEQSEQSMEESGISVSDDENYRSIYTQHGYFYDSYIIEIGWNVYGDAYFAQTKFVLEDGSAMKVYFTDTSKDHIADQRVIAAASGLISYLKNINTYPAIETPVITKVIYAGDKDMTALREKFYQDGDVYGFAALFSLLSTTEQTEWYQKIYEADQSAFFSAVIGYMDNDLISVYADKADQDGKTNFFSALLNYMQPDTIEQYAEKYYAADDVARFTILIPYMTEKEQQDWIRKAHNDGKKIFSAVLSENLF